MNSCHEGNIGNTDCLYAKELARIKMHGRGWKMFHECDTLKIRTHPVALLYALWASSPIFSSCSWDKAVLPCKPACSQTFSGKHQPSTSPQLMCCRLLHSLCTVAALGALPRHQLFGSTCLSPKLIQICLVKEGYQAQVSCIGGGWSEMEQVIQANLSLVVAWFPCYQCAQPQTSWSKKFVREMGFNVKKSNESVLL